MLELVSSGANGAWLPTWAADKEQVVLQPHIMGKSARKCEQERQGGTAVQGAEALPSRQQPNEQVWVCRGAYEAVYLATVS